MREARGQALRVPSAVGRAKLFANGRSQAVRLPRQYRLPGREVFVSWEGHRLVLVPIDEKGRPAFLWDRLDALLEGLVFDWKRPKDPVPRPIRRERALP